MLMCCLTFFLHTFHRYLHRWKCCGCSFEHFHGRILCKKIVSSQRGPKNHQLKLHPPISHVIASLSVGTCTDGNVGNLILHHIAKFGFLIQYGKKMAVIKPTVANFEKSGTVKLFSINFSIGTWSDGLLGNAIVHHSAKYELSNMNGKVVPAKTKSTAPAARLPGASNLANNF